MQIKARIEKIIKICSKDRTQNQAMRLSLLFTFIIWLFIFVVLAVSPGLNQKKKYKTVRISLAPLPVEKPKAEEKKPVEQKIIEKPTASEILKQKEAEKKSQPAKKAQNEQKTEQKPQVSSAVKNQPSQSNAKTEAPAVPEPKKAVIKYKKSVDELLNEQNSSSKNKNFDWDRMDFSENTNSSASAQNHPAPDAQKLNNSSALSGTAGTKSGGGGKISSEPRNVSAGTNASSETAAQLGEISKTEYSYSAASGIDVSAKINQHKDGKYSMPMTDGTARILRNPEKPELQIKNTDKIDTSKEVTITLKILADGTVPLGGVSFSPAAVLDASVRSELATQIQKWEFSPAPADGQASFVYTIIKR